MEQEGDNEIISEFVYVSGDKSKKSSTLESLLKGVIVVLLVSVFGIFGAAIFWGINQNRMFVTNGDSYHDSYESILSFVRHHSAYALTHPNDPTEILNGSVTRVGGIMYARVYRNDMFVLAKYTETGIMSDFFGGTEIIITEDVRPAFITAHGDYIYFTDGLSYYRIFRVPADGGVTDLVMQVNASFLTIAGEYLYFTNHSDRDRLYRIHLETRAAELVLDVIAYDLTYTQGRLFFVNGNDDYTIHSLDLRTPVIGESVRLNDSNSDNLRVNGSAIFYRIVDDGSIARMDLNGNPIPLNIPAQVSTFDINGNFIALIRLNYGVIYFYNLDTGVLQRPDGDVIQASYVRVVPDPNYYLAYYLSFGDSREMGSAMLPRAR
jgi:hypothetical protein